MSKLHRLIQLLASYGAFAVIETKAVPTEQSCVVEVYCKLKLPYFPAVGKDGSIEESGADEYEVLRLCAGRWLDHLAHRAHLETKAHESAAHKLQELFDS
jgi:hypothetical protein